MCTNNISNMFDKESWPTFVKSVEESVDFVAESDDYIYHRFEYISFQNQYVGMGL